MNEYNFVKQLQALFEKEGFLTQREIGVGYGIADLVLVKKNKVNLKHCRVRKNHGQLSPLLSEEYFKTLKQLPDEDSQEDSVGFKYLAEKSSLSKSYLKYQILKNLEKHGYIKRVGDNHYFKVNGWLPIANELVAIEAKLTDWKRGAIQANRYRAFAHKVYLAVPKETARLVDKSFLKKHDIGLIALDVKNKQKSVILQSKTITPIDEYKFNFATEYFWGKKQLVNFA